MRSWPGLTQPSLNPHALTHIAQLATIPKSPDAHLPPPLPAPWPWALLQTSILRIALDIVRGLQHLHKKHIIHGDLTPGNVLLRWAASASGKPAGGPPKLLAKLGDFGLSVKVGVGACMCAHKGVGACVGEGLLCTGPLACVAVCADRLR